MTELLARPPAGAVALRWLGQGGFIFRSPGDVTWAVDPYLTDYSAGSGSTRRRWRRRSCAWMRYSVVITTPTTSTRRR